MLILDWDVHHGNGTEAIFAGDSDVLFVSIHEWPLYPGTGPASYLGEGAGEGYTVNLPVPGGSGDAVYRSLVEHVAAPLVLAWEPQLVLVSAGFDAHRADPLATCTVTEAGFAGMTASLRAACDAVGAPLGLVLEGGYDLGALAGSMAALMPVLVDRRRRIRATVERHPLAAQALDAARAVLAGALGRAASGRGRPSPTVPGSPVAVARRPSARRAARRRPRPGRRGPAAPGRRRARLSYWPEKTTNLSGSSEP